MMTRRFKTTTLMFFSVAAVTLALWILRGLTLLGFMPGWILWGLIIASMLLAVLSAIR